MLSSRKIMGDLRTWLVFNSRKIIGDLRTLANVEVRKNHWVISKVWVMLNERKGDWVIPELPWHRVFSELWLSNVEFRFRTKIIGYFWN